MRRTWSVTVARDERPKAVWRQVGKIMRSWAGEATVTPIGDFMWTADTASAEVADALAASLVAAGVEPLRSWDSKYEDEDYAVADLIAIFGIDLSLDPPFVRNEADAYREDPPCPQCGHGDAFDVTVVAPPQIDEAMLDAPIDGSQPGPHGWEVVNLPNGGLLLSTRLITELRDAGIRGLATEPVLDATGAPSRRMAAVRAPVSVLTPCSSHSRVDGAAFCARCGTARGDLEGFFFMPRSSVGTAEIVARHPHRASMLHMSVRACAIIGEAAGFRRGDPVRLCDD